MNRDTKKKNNFWIDIIKKHVDVNKKEYIIICIVFLIGIILGVMFINQADDANKEEIGQYINSFVDCVKNDYEINMGELIKTSILNNILLSVLIWFMGSTVIGIPVVFIIVGVRGFCLGYTISSIIYTYGMLKGSIFCITGLMIQNIFFIPAIFALAVSGMKVYNTIIKDKRRENIKTQICRHTIFSLMVTLLLIVASIVEVYISTNLLICSLTIM